nr:putative acid phosphatase spbc4.06 [Quercus suber]
MTTLSPRPSYTSEELAALYPSFLELTQVQVLLRHGERTPVSPRFQDAGLQPHWPLCQAARRLKNVVMASMSEDDAQRWGDLVWRRQLERLGKGDVAQLRRSSEQEAEGICQPGELTDLGRQTTLQLGQRLRSLYVGQLGFLPDNLASDVKDIDSIIRLRSTPIPRALESVQQAFVGLYPPSTRSPSSIPVVVTRSMQEETLFPNESACPRFAELSAAFAERAASLWNDSPEMEYINRKIGKWMPQGKNGVPSRIAVNSHPRLSGIMDSINATLAHERSVVGKRGVSLPKEFYDNDVRKNIDRICTEEWFGGYQNSSEYRKLGIGALVGDLTQNMIENCKSPGFKMAMAGCHDTTLASVLTSLGAFDVAKDKWPNFTSSIALEVFRHGETRSSMPASSPARPSWWSALFSAVTPSEKMSVRTPLDEMSSSQKSVLDGYYVRLRYNDRPVTLPFCAMRPDRHLSSHVAEGVDGKQFCTLAAFKEAADSVTPQDWRSECKMNLGKPTVSAVPSWPPGVAAKDE